jgi:hypothetical protein
VASSRAYYTIIKETLQKNPITGEEEQFYKPTDEQVENKSQSYDKITETGWLGTHVTSNDVVISKYMPNRGEQGRDASYALHERARHRRPSSPRPRHSTVNGDGCKVCLRNSTETADRRQAVQPLGTKARSGCWCPRTTCPSLTASSRHRHQPALPQPHDDRAAAGGCWARRAAWTAGGGRRSTARYEDVWKQLAACGMDMSGDEACTTPAPAARWTSRPDDGVVPAPEAHRGRQRFTAAAVRDRSSAFPAASGGSRQGEDFALGRWNKRYLRPWNVEFLKERFSECSDGFDPPLLRVRSQRSTPSGRVPLPIVSNNVDFRQVVVPYAFKLMSQEVGRWESNNLKSNHVAANTWHPLKTPEE